MEKYQIAHPTNNTTLKVAEDIYTYFVNLPLESRLGYFEALVAATSSTPSQAAAVPVLEPEVASSIEATLAQRGSRYGDFTDHARLCQNLMADMQKFRKGDNDGVEFTPWEYLSDVQKQALTVIADKIARILSGDPNYDDNWHDIQGYAKLAEDRLPCNQVKETPNV